jgi:hypothetical protein
VLKYCPRGTESNLWLQWETGHDESVEVNQRALIDKVLARYSGEFTGEIGDTTQSDLSLIVEFYSVSRASAEL